MSNGDPLLEERLDRLENRLTAVEIRAEHIEAAHGLLESRITYVILGVILAMAVAIASASIGVGGIGA